MKALHLSAALAFLPAAFTYAEVIPVAFSASRYEKMLADSPFALATPTVPDKGPVEPSWSANLTLGPVWRIVRDGVEREYAVIKSKGDISGSFTLMGHEESPEGISLVKIDWSDDITKTRATIKKGTETANLEADQAGAAPPPPVAPQQPRPNGAGGLLNRALNVRNPAQPAVPQPAMRQPSVPQPVIPRPAGAPPANPLPSANNPYNKLPVPSPNNANTGNDRKRVRVIDSK